jgi:oligoendopeptidase F
MKLKLAKGGIASGMLKGSLALGALLSFAVFPEGRASKKKKSSEGTGNEYTSEELNSNEITTEWDDLYLFSSREKALEELERLKKKTTGDKRNFPP